MKKVTIHLRSIAPYTQSRQHHTPKLEKENAQDYEERTWLEKTTVNDNGEICIPAMAFKQALDRSAKMLSMQIPGRGKATYTKHFAAGVMIPENLNIGVKKSDATKITINANADGRRGSGKRVVRHFPQVYKWEGVLEAFIIDETITPDVFERHAKEAGMLVGVGQYRPENGGTNGRFVCDKFEWSDVS